MSSPLARPALALLCALAFAAAPSAAQDRLSEPSRWLRDYVRIDTTNPPGDEHRAVAFLAAILHREGIPTRLLVSPGGRTSLYARLEATVPPRERRPGALVLLHHTDVVPPGSGWSVDPFAGEIRDGVLYGRGALDIKSLGVAHLAAFVDLARGLRQGRLALARDVVYLAVADEERGGIEGAAWILERHRDLLGEIAGVLGEGGANRTVNGRYLWAGVEVAQKRPLWLRISARGRAGHGSGLNPGSAPHRLVQGLARALDLPPRWRVTEASRLYLGAIAPLHNPTLQRVFEDPDSYIREDGPTTSLLPGLANLFLDTFQVTVLEGSDKINVVPAEASAQVDVRLLPETDAGEYLDRLRKALGDDLEVEVLLTSPPAPPAPLENPVYRAVAKVLGETAPVVPAFIPGFTDSRYFRERGIAAYGVSPFFLEPQRFLGIHGADESIPLAELERGVERMRRIVRASATP
jgi:acetylornithine deacetylase/succinyl-diaminopimelate desuccinylase-like protein